jgi:hypothetical protein
MSVLLALLAGCQDPPETSLGEAEAALREARKSGATQFAAGTFRRAATLTEDGRMEMARQKGRLAPMRDFAPADSLLREAIRTAHRARDEAIRNRDSVDRLVAEQIRELALESSELEGLLDRSLTYNRLHGHMLKAELHLTTARKFATDGSFSSAQQELAAARKALGKVISEMTDYAADEADRLVVWRRWVKETVDASRKSGDHAVIVDKSAHTTYLIKAGRIVHRYDCDLGFNPSRQKSFAGDAATPEGKYRVVKVKKSGSRYYKALLLDYPNERDRARFRENRQRGIIPHDAKIGGLIEIHGEGGREVDWTEGCVALSNQDMDHLMRFVREGTAVTIVRTSDQWP